MNVDQYQPISEIVIVDPGIARYCFSRVIAAWHLPCTAQFVAILETTDFLKRFLAMDKMRSLGEVSLGYEIFCFNIVPTHVEDSGQVKDPWTTKYERNKIHSMDNARLISAIPAKHPGDRNTTALRVEIMYWLGSDSKISCTNLLTQTEHVWLVEHLMAIAIDAHGVLHIRVILGPEIQKFLSCHKLCTLTEQPLGFKIILIDVLVIDDLLGQMSKCTTDRFDNCILTKFTNDGVTVDFVFDVICPSKTRKLATSI